MVTKQYTTITSFIALLALLFFTFFYNLAFLPLHTWDEGRVVTNALNMHLNGNWFVTYFDGVPDLWNTKPPMLIWMQVISIRIFGINEWAVRFPSAIASVLTGLILWAFCTRYLKNKWLGFLAGGVFATTYSYVFNHAGRTGDYDALLNLFNVLYCLSFYLFCSTNRSKWLILFFVFLTFAALTKGIAGLFLAPSVLLYTLTQKKLPTILTNKLFYAGMLGFLIVAVGYYFLRDHYNPGYIKAVLAGELGSFPKTLNQHLHPFLWYVKNMLDWRYPYWYLFIAPAFIVGFFSRLENAKRLTIFNFSMVAPYMLVISAASTKLFWYDLAVYPFLSLQIGLMLYIVWILLENNLPILSQPKKALLAAVFLAMFFTYPLRTIYRHNRHTSTSWPWDVDVNERKQGLFIQQAIKNKQSLDNYVFCYDGCDRCHGQIDFYIIKLQMDNVKVRFQSTLDSLKAGTHIVVSQPEMKQKLEATYHVKMEQEAFGCTVFTIE